MEALQKLFGDEFDVSMVYEQIHILTPYMDVGSHDQKIKIELFSVVWQHLCLLNVTSLYRYLEKMISL